MTLGLWLVRGSETPPNQPPNTVSVQAARRVDWDRFNADVSDLSEALRLS